MEFKQIPHKDLNIYDHLVDDSREGTIFHKSWWFNSFKNDRSINANKAIFFGAYKNGKLVAGFPVPYRDMLFHRLIINPKLTAYQGTIFDNTTFDKVCKQTTHVKNINEGFAKILVKQGICLFYPFNIHSVDIQPFIWLNFKINVYFTYLLKLQDIDHILANMDKKRRNDITHCSKNNYLIKTGDVDTFIKLHINSLSRKKAGSVPDQIWKDVYSECKKHNACEIFTIYRDDEPRASMFLVWDNKRSYYIGGGISDHSNGDMSLLIWEAIKYTKEKLCLDEFDFEGSMVPGIESYFRKFGGKLVPRFAIINRILSLRKPHYG